MNRLTPKLIIGFLAITSLSNLSFPQGLDPDWKKSVVLMEQKSSTSFTPIATASLVLFQKVVFVVTNRHVAEDTALLIRLNSKLASGSPIRISVDTLLAYIQLPWALSQNADLAALPLVFYPSINKYQDSAEIKSFGISLFKDWNYINEGDEIFVLGFPLGIGANPHFSAVYRSGIVALKEVKGYYLIDSRIYPGNSGGPVFMKPSIYDYRTGSLGEGTIGYFVGIVSSYLPYIDVAISAQTKRPRVTFEENSGLAIVYSSDTLIELLTEYIAKYPIK